MRNFNLDREKKELTLDVLYDILFQMYGTDIARKKYKDLTGMEYVPEYMEAENE